MKILILGCNSFIGYSLIEFINQLKARKQNIKLNLVSRSSIRPELAKYKKIFHQIDLNKNIKKLINLIKQNKPNLIFNFSAQSIVQDSWKYPLDWFNTNLISNIELLDFLKNYDSLDKYIQSSTPEVYGSTKGIINESFKYFPSTPYATSKASIDFLLKNYYDNYSFPVVFSRISNIYGPGQQLFKIVPKSILNIKKKQKIPIHGDGLSRRSFIYSDDVSSALCKLMLNGTIGEIYHISDSNYISIKSLVAKICKIMNVDFKSSIQFKADREGKDFFYGLKSEKIRKQLKWKPKINLDSGLKKTIKWVENNYQKIKNKKLYYEHKK